MDGGIKNGLGFTVEVGFTVAGGCGGIETGLGLGFRWEAEEDDEGEREGMS